MVRVELLGRALIVLREKQGMTQEGLSAAAKVTPSMISNYERGKERPSIESLWKVLEGLGCSLIDLEAALRFVNDEPFPLNCASWGMTLDSEPGLARSQRGAEGVAEAGRQAEALLQGLRPLSPEVEQSVLAILGGLWGLRGLLNDKSS